MHMRINNGLLTFIIIALFTIVFLCINEGFGDKLSLVFPVKAHLSSAEKQISPDILYSDMLPPNSTKSYVVNVAEKSVLVLGLRTIGGEASIERSFEGNGGKITVIFTPFPEGGIGSLYYSAEGGEVTITLRNLDEERTVNYEFYVDISRPISRTDSKDIILEGFPVVFHVDLKKDEELSIDFSSSETEKPPQIEVYVLYLTQKGYLFRQHASSSDGHLRVKADLKDRYYIVIRPQTNEKKIFLHTKLESPLWDQLWFWPIVGVGLSVIFTVWIWLNVKDLRGKLQREGKYTLISDYLSLLAISTFSSLLGAYDSRAQTLLPLFYLATLFYALSLGSHLYAAYLRRKVPVAICPHCYRRVNIEEVGFCCGEKVKRVSNLWYLMPLAFGLSFLFATYTLPDFFGDTFSFSLKAGSFGCFLGGIISWIVNRNAAEKTWMYIPISIVMALIFPWLISFIVVFSEIFLPVIHYEIYGNIGLVFRLIRVNAAAPVSSGFAATYIFLAALTIYLLHKQIKMAMAYT